MRAQDVDAVTPRPTTHDFVNDRAPSAYEPSAASSAYDAGGNAAAYDPESGEPEQAGSNPSWWGDERAEAANAAPGAPQAPAFLSAGDSFAEDESGFISPMGAYTPSASPAPTSQYQQPQQPQSHRRTTTREEMEELGLGNSKSRKPGFEAINEQAGEGEEGAASPSSSERPAEQQQPQAPGALQIGRAHV